MLSGSSSMHQYLPLCYFAYSFAGSSGNITWLEHTGDGSFFEKSTTIASGHGCESVAVADLNEDGHLDIIAADTSGFGLVWYENRGNASSWSAPRLVFAGNYIMDVNVGYFDTDTHLDIAAISQNSDLNLYEVNLYQTNGVMANFSAHCEPVIGNLTDAKRIAVADFNNDSISDVVCMGGYYGKMSAVHSVIAPDGSHTWDQSNVTEMPRPWGAAVGDFDLNGVQDFVASSVDYAEFSWFSFGDDPLAPWAEHVISDPGVIQSDTVASADMDKDGDLDLVTSRGVDGVLWFENNGKGNFSGPIGVDVFTIDDRNYVRSLTLPDVNSDGFPDIVAYLYQLKKVVLYVNGT